jgi:diaminopimelate epimerase
MQPNSIAKYHALGNDYIVVDPAYLAAPMTGENIRLLCDRHFGVGSDGILYGPLPQTQQQSRQLITENSQEKNQPVPMADEPFRVRIFNPDGGEAEKSGNGVRIFSKYLVDAGYTQGRMKFDVHTLGGLVRVTLLNPQAELIEADMGTASFHSPEIPVAGDAREVVDEEISLGGAPYRMTCVTVGNPHCVLVLYEVSETHARSLGPIVETHPLFPNRINMQIVRVIDRHAIQIEIWERGAGYTLASGSSSCAAAAAAHRLGLVDEAVAVHMPGGRIDIRIAPDGHLIMRGSVTPVYEGRLAPAFFTP